MSTLPARIPHTPQIRTDYLSVVMHPKTLAVTVKRAAEYLRRLDFDALAFRGMSGALIAPALAMELGKTFLLVRKDGDSTHSCYEVEGDVNARSYVIVDDFISSGKTALEIINALRRHVPGANCAGIFEYDHIGANNLKPTIELRCGTELMRLAAAGVVLSREEANTLWLRYPLS